jgi:YVTN family beta-propeller protein
VVWVIDTLTLKVVAVIEGDNVGAYGYAGGIAFTPDGKHAYVATSDPYYYAPPPLASVLVVDTVNFSVTQVPLPGFSVGGIAITPDGKYAYIAGTDSGILVLDTAKLAVTAQIPVAGFEIAITPDGKHGYVGNSVIETATNTVVATLPVTGNGPAITPDGEHVYLANTVIETATNTIVATLPVTMGHHSASRGRSIHGLYLQAQYQFEP